MKENLVVFFSRLPNSSFNGKTRLKSEINSKLVDDISKGLIFDLLDELVLKNSTFDTIFFYQGIKEKNEEIDSKYNNIIKYEKQPDTDFGNKLKYIFKKYFQYYKKIVVIGSDCPFINSRIVEDCFKNLDRCNTVLIPMEDFGYGLIGTDRYVDIFTKIKNWKSRTEGYNLVHETLSECLDNNLTVTILEKRFDIDTKNDIVKLRNRLFDGDKELDHLKRVKRIFLNDINF